MHHMVVLTAQENHNVNSAKIWFGVILIWKNGKEEKMQLLPCTNNYDNLTF